MIHANAACATSDIIVFLQTGKLRHFVTLHINTHDCNHLIDKCIVNTLYGDLGLYSSQTERLEDALIRPV